MAHQKGTLYEAAGKWYVRYSVASINGRVKKSYQLGSTDLKKDEMKRRCVAHMTEVNKRDKDHTGLQQDMTVAQFWEQHYLPYCETILAVTGKPRKKHSTMVGYRQIWKTHLQAHFGDTSLRGYTPMMGNAFLRRLDGPMGRRSISHVKNAASAIFSLAVEHDFLSSNPWREVRIPKDAVAPGDTHHYTLKEAENLLTALVHRPDCQLVMALACVLGLRPSEIGALRWSDITKDYIHIRQAIVHGVVGTPKTRGSVRDIPLDNAFGDILRAPLKAWAARAQSADWVFDNGSGQPLDLDHLALRVIRPIMEKAGLKWKGMYAGRRGAATIINDPYLASRILGNSLATCVAFYDKGLSPAALKAGMKNVKLLEA